MCFMCLNRLYQSYILLSVKLSMVKISIVILSKVYNFIRNYINATDYIFIRVT